VNAPVIKAIAARRARKSGRMGPSANNSSS